MRKRPPPEKTTWWAAAAEKGRAKANKLSDAQRQQLMARAMVAIYGDHADAASAPHRRGH